jgi:hypothetical protein
LNLLGVGSTEAEMAELTQTRPGTGATLIRALDGLEKKLAEQSIQPVLLQPTWSDLQAISMPVVTPLQFEATRQHMVTLTRISPAGVSYIDPVDGYSKLGRSAFEQVFTGHVIAFESR